MCLFETKEEARKAMNESEGELKGNEGLHKREKDFGIANEWK